MIMWSNGAYGTNRSIQWLQCFMTVTSLPFLAVLHYRWLGMLRKNNAQSVLYHICHRLPQTAQLQPVPVLICSHLTLGMPQAELRAQSGTGPHRKKTLKIPLTLHLEWLVNKKLLCFGSSKRMVATAPTTERDGKPSY